MIRFSEKRDNRTLFFMLKGEGLSDSEMMIQEHFTWVLEEDGVLKGFFTVRNKPSYGYPVLSHFIVSKKYRSMAMARKLIKAVLVQIKNLSAKMFIIDSLCNRKVCKFIEYYFKVKPYSEKNGYSYYLVRV